MSRAVKNHHLALNCNTVFKEKMLKFVVSIYRKLLTEKCDMVKFNQHIYNSKNRHAESNFLIDTPTSVCLREKY